MLFAIAFVAVTYLATLGLLHIPGVANLLEKFIFMIILFPNEVTDELEQQHTRCRIRRLAKRKLPDQTSHSSELYKLMNKMAYEYTPLLLWHRRNLRAKHRQSFMFGLTRMPLWASWELQKEHEKSARHEYLDVNLRLFQNAAFMDRCLHLMHRAHSACGERHALSLVEDMRRHIYQMDRALKAKKTSA